MKPNKLQWRSLAKSSLKKQLQHKPVATLAPPCPVQSLSLGLVSEAGEGAEGLLAEGALGQPSMGSNTTMMLLGIISRLESLIIIDKIHSIDLQAGV